MAKPPRSPVEFLQATMESDDLEEQPSNETIMSRLVSWIKSNGGEVHSSLELRTIGHDNRGLFASEKIYRGDVLIRLPVELSIHGEELPSSWQDDESRERQASPWLRALSAFWAAQEDTDREPYIQSLPTFYDTIWEWSDQEIEDYLGGSFSQGGSTVGWKVDREMTEERYRTQVRPYLMFNGIVQPDEVEIDDLEYERFSVACQCISTRCFHLAVSEDIVSSDDNSGPFLLPLMDLMNHSTTQKCTTLKRLADAFVMTAEKDIEENQEILHSYGDDLTAAQFLQTFGFVPGSIMQKCCDENSQQTNITPGILAKDLILGSCWDVIAEEVPVKLASSMEEQGMEDEVWSIKADRSRTGSFLPDDILIQPDNPLSDELITLACLPFLPKCAYQEAASGMLGRSILDDYFLGKLVCSSLLKALQSRLSSYDTLVKSSSLSNEQKQLRDLLRGGSNSTSGDESESSEGDDLSRQRLMYGLSVCAEEMKSLDRLRREILGILARLDEEAEVEEDASDRDAKRHRR